MQYSRNQTLLRNFLYFSRLRCKMFSIGPSRRLNSSRPIDSSLHFVTARMLACRTVFFMSAISPKYSFSLYLKTTSFLPVLGLSFSATRLPSMTKQRRSPSSPSLTTQSLGSNSSSLRASQSCCFSQSCTSESISMRLMIFSWSLRLRMADSWTMLMKVRRSRAKMVPDLLHLMEAARLALYMRESSPNSSPALQVLRQVAFPLINFVHSYSPDAITYNMSPASPSRMISFPTAHFTSSIDPTTTPMFSSDSPWNMIDFFSRPRMRSVESLFLACSCGVKAAFWLQSPKTSALMPLRLFFLPPFRCILSCSLRANCSSCSFVITSSSETGSVPMRLISVGCASCRCAYCRMNSMMLAGRAWASSSRRGFKTGFTWFCKYCLISSFRSAIEEFNRTTKSKYKSKISHQERCLRFTEEISPSKDSLTILSMISRFEECSPLKEASSLESLERRSSMGRSSDSALRSSKPTLLKMLKQLISCFSSSFFSASSEVSISFFARISPSRIWITFSLQLLRWDNCSRSAWLCRNRLCSCSCSSAVFSAEASACSSFSFNSRFAARISLFWRSVAASLSCSWWVRSRISQICRFMSLKSSKLTLFSSDSSCSNWHSRRYCSTFFTASLFSSRSAPISSWLARFSATKPFISYRHESYFSCSSCSSPTFSSRAVLSSSSLSSIPPFSRRQASSRRSISSLSLSTSWGSSLSRSLLVLSSSCSRKVQQPDRELICTQKSATMPLSRAISSCRVRTSSSSLRCPSSKSRLATTDRRLFLRALPSLTSSLPSSMQISDLRAGRRKKSGLTRCRSSSAL